MKKLYRVTIAFEEGFSVWVKAESEEQAEEFALQDVEMFAGVFDSMYQQKRKSYDYDTTHRDYFVADIQQEDI